MGPLCYKLLCVSLFATVLTSNANAQSNDGNWMTYAYRRHKSDDTLYVRNLETDREFENQIDFMTRMEQFYAHYLKGEPAPEWMVRGIPFLQKKQAAQALVKKPVP